MYALWDYLLHSLIVQSVKNLPAVKETRVWFLGQKNPLEKEMATFPASLPGESHGQRGLTDYSPRGRKSQTQLSDYTTSTDVNTEAQCHQLCSSRCRSCCQITLASRCPCLPATVSVGCEELAAPEHLPGLLEMPENLKWLFDMDFQQASPLCLNSVVLFTVQSSPRDQGEAQLQLWQHGCSAPSPALFRFLHLPIVLKPTFNKSSASRTLTLNTKYICKRGKCQRAICNILRLHSSHFSLHANVYLRQESFACFCWKQMTVLSLSASIEGFPIFLLSHMLSDLSFELCNVFSLHFS